MDIAKLSGLVDAIEQEHIQPNPSHSNLARLVVLFMRELISFYESEIHNPEDPEPHVDIALRDTMDSLHQDILPEIEIKRIKRKLVKNRK